MVASNKKSYESSPTTVVEDVSFDAPNKAFEFGFGLTDMGKYAVLYAKNVTVNLEEGKLTENVTLKHATSYLHFPAGFQFFIDGNSDIVIAEAKLETVYNAFSFKDLQPKSEKGDVCIANNHIGITTDGKLAKDVYVPFFVPEKGEDMSLKWDLIVGDETDDRHAQYIETPGAKKVMPGMVYKVQETTFPGKVFDWDSTIGNEDTDLDQGG